MNDTTGGASESFPRGVSDPFCPVGCPIETPTDHRLLWHLEAVLAVDAPTGSRLDHVRRDLRRYLNERCDHHWHFSNDEDDVSAHWQCLWCDDVRRWPNGLSDPAAPAAKQRLTVRRTAALLVPRQD